VQLLIHASPERLWYVEGFLIPELLRQGLREDEVEVWLDGRHGERRGNLLSCMDSFAARKGEGAEGTWHIQDDVLPCRDFVQRCQAHDDGVVYGFCCEQFRDDPAQTGFVYPADMWHSFQGLRIPDELARECAAWFFEYASLEPMYYENTKTGKMDDSFFHEFMETKHAADRVYNMRPCLVEHVDRLIGGSLLNEWREYWARATWFDESRVDELREWLRKESKS
jgi:hypothetical protein